MKIHLAIGVLVFVGCPSPVDVGGDGGVGGGSAVGGGNSMGGGTTAGGGAGGTAAGGGADGGPLSLEQFCDQLVTAECGFFVRCHGALSLETCAPLMAPAVVRNTFCNRFVPSEIDAGVRPFDAAAAARCLAEFDTLSCQLGPSALPQDCDSVFSGRVPLNGPCVTDVECETGDYCRVGSSQCGGTCAARIAIGQSVGNPFFGPECVDGGEPVQGICTPLVGTLRLGAPCANPDGGGFPGFPCAVGGCGGIPC